MFEWLGDLWDSISSTTSTISWGDVATDSLMTSVAGAAIGALASAVTDGDVGEGLLYGAAGGLVAGGIMEFGSQFSDNWSWSESSAVTGTGTIDVSDITSEFKVDMPYDNWDEGLTLGTGSSGNTGSAQSSYMQKFLNIAQPQEESWMKTLAPTALTVGGSMLAGAFADDPVEQQAELAQISYDREDELGARASSALASVKANRGASYVDKSDSMKSDFAEIEGAVTV